MTIHLSCEHEVQDMTDAFDVSLGDYDELGEACVIYARVCKACRDWGRSYDMSLTSETYGTTWWFQDPAAATLTLLRWS
jgi:hypothetical protein